MPAFVGLLTVDLYLPEALTLKDKRQVLQSLMDRLAARFNVAVAEVGRNDNHHNAQIAAACVSNARPHCEEILDQVFSMLDSNPRVMIVGQQREIF